MDIGMTSTEKKIERFIGTLEAMGGSAGNRKIIIIAGPNGAGKTTFARSFLPAEAQLLRFINADLIAAGLAPFAPESVAIKAGRLMLEEIGLCARRGENFAFETTLSGLGYLRHIERWQRQGYRVSLFFLSLPDDDTAVARVAERVRQGGHDVPEPVIRRRFAAGRKNFEQHYRLMVDDWALYDNAGSSPALLEWGEKP
jgi:predicted ABC-type ATPase